MGPGGAKRQDFFKFIIRREGEKPQEELLWSAIKLPKELTTEILYLELPTISASCGVKRNMQ